MPRSLRLICVALVLAPQANTVLKVFMSGQIATPVFRKALASGDHSVSRRVLVFLAGDLGGADGGGCAGDNADHPFPAAYFGGLTAGGVKG